jgi:hypothetical protein
MDKITKALVQTVKQIINEEILQNTPFMKDARNIGKFPPSGEIPEISNTDFQKIRSKLDGIIKSRRTLEYRPTPNQDQPSSRTLEYRPTPNQDQPSTSTLLDYRYGQPKHTKPPKRGVTKSGKIINIYDPGYTPRPGREHILDGSGRRNVYHDAEGNVHVTYGIDNGPPPGMSHGRGDYVEIDDDYKEGDNPTDYYNRKTKDRRQYMDSMILRPRDDDDYIRPRPYNKKEKFLLDQKPDMIGKDKPKPPAWPPVPSGPPGGGGGGNPPPSPEPDPKKPKPKKTNWLAL